MLLRSLELNQFRNYRDAHLDLAPGVTVIVGDNGQGKSNLLESVGYLATLGSFRSTPLEALITDGADEAIIRAEGTRESRSLLLEASLLRSGRNRTMVNRQPLRRSRDLLGALRVTVFAPDDLELVKDGPGIRRRFIDDAVVAVTPKQDLVRGDVDKVLRQRNALLKQAKGRLTPDVEATLDVWDAKFAEVGTALALARVAMVDMLTPVIASSYAALTDGSRDASLHYTPTWLDDGLLGALHATRIDDLRRGVTTVGPHRDELELILAGRPARTHASQGEQRTFALALRLASHRVVTDATGTSPVLLLDDVFSELDAKRSDALLANLPDGQTLLTTAGALPSATRPDLVVRVVAGTISIP